MGDPANKTRLLVFPSGSEIGLEIHNALKWSKNVELIGASSVGDHGQFVFKHNIEDVPMVDQPGFIKRIKKVIKQQQIDMIFPAHDSAVLTLAESRNELGCLILTSPTDTCRICRSKRRTYAHFESLVRVPAVYEKEAPDILYPVFLKPEVGQGTKGTFLASTPKEVEFYQIKDPSLMILEYLPGPEYTVDCFTDRNGILKFVGPRDRARILNGISVSSHPVTGAEFDDMAHVINENLRFRGVWFFQVKRAEGGELALLEAAPRVGGTMGLTRNRGANLALMTVYDFLDQDVDIVMNEPELAVDRALASRYQIDLTYEHVYLDFDDTLVLNDVVNAQLVMFLIQCVNKGIKLHLVSKHQQVFDEPVTQALKTYRLFELFDEVVDISRGNEKASYIKEKNAIFIDDSFSERKKIAEKCTIPVFDLDAVESLIDWKA